MAKKYSFGAEKSPFDLRTFRYSADKAALPPHSAGESWANTAYIDDQHRVGICTAISMTMRAHRHFGVQFSPDFQYLLQKKYVDGNWNEGSSALSACKVGNKYGFLPKDKWKFTTEEDRKLSYSKYIDKLKRITDAEIEEMLQEAAKYKISAYAKLNNSVYDLGGAIAENGAVIARFVVGEEWWKTPIEPLRRAAKPISGHLVNITKRVGDSYRIANSWGKDWVDGGTAYGLYATYSPTEMWQVWFSGVPNEIEEQKKKLASLQGQLITLLQKYVIELSKKLWSIR